MEDSNPDIFTHINFLPTQNALDSIDLRDPIIWNTGILTGNL